MSERRWTANSFDAARDEVIGTLRTYRVERINIAREKALLAEAIDSLYAPTGAGCSEDMIRTAPLHGDDAMLRTIGRIEQERRGLDREMRGVQEREDKLNAYLRAILALPTFERRIVVGIYIDGKEFEEVCKDAGKSDDAAIHHRKSAIRKLTRALYHVDVKVITPECP